MKTKRQIQRIISEAKKRTELRKHLDAAGILFGSQRAFVEDPSRLKAALCSRRAGKSFGVAFMAAQHLFRHERCIIPYVTLTRDTGKDILWTAMFKIDRQFNLNLKFKENTGDIVAPNGSKIVIRGADDQRQIEKLRGPSYPIAFVDEAQGFPPYLRSLLYNVLKPATIDYKGQIVVTGTPNEVCAGPFYALTTGDEKWQGWSVHKWTLRENEHLPDVEQQIQDMMVEQGWTEEHPSYRREFLGEWVRDTAGMVFDFDEYMNTMPTFDPEDIPDIEYALGIDLGYNDPTAFVTLAYSESLGQVFVVESHKESGLIPSAVAVRVEALTYKYPYSFIVADTGGFGKGYVEEMRQKFNLPVRAAKKIDKAAYVEMLNGDLRSNTLMIARDRNGSLIDEMLHLQWDLEALERGKFRMDKQRYENHLSDALIYGWRECRHHANEWETVGPAYGTREYWNQIADDMEEQDCENLRVGSETPWWSKL